jgi:hypothetical protein
MRDVFLPPASPPKGVGGRGPALELDQLGGTARARLRPAGMLLPGGSPDRGLCHHGGP